MIIGRTCQTRFGIITQQFIHADNIYNDIVICISKLNQRTLLILISIISAQNNYYSWNSSSNSISLIFHHGNSRSPKTFPTKCSSNGTVVVVWRSETTRPSEAIIIKLASPENFTADCILPKYAHVEVFRICIICTVCHNDTMRGYSSSKLQTGHPVIQRIINIIMIILDSPQWLQSQLYYPGAHVIN